MISYGIDIGTTTLRAVAVRITLGHFGERSHEALGDPLCVFTPYDSKREIEEENLLRTIEEWRSKNALPPPDIGTLLFTGEAQRAANSVRVGNRLTEHWNGLLSAQLNPELESRIAAFGSGAAALSASHLGKAVVHIDIGGGTANFAWLENGEIVDTSCLNIGCRKWIVDESGKPLHTTREGTYLEGLVPGSLPEKFPALCRKMSELLLQHARREGNEELSPLIVSPWKEKREAREVLLSVSGGIAECSEEISFRYGDIGPLFRQVFVESAREKGQQLVFSQLEGKATALGVSTYGFQVSGGSIHVDSGLAQSQRNLPLYSEAQLASIPEMPVRVAIEMAAHDTQAQSIERLAEKWRGFLTERGVAEALFLFPVNIGKTFGHYFSRGTSRPKIWVLDNIAPEKSAVGVRTVDLTYSVASDRYLVILKTLHLF